MNLKQKIYSTNPRGRNFEYSLLDREHLDMEYIDGERHYVLDGVHLKSVTTVIKGASDTSALYEWRERLGRVEADRISSESRRHGIHFHTIFENYLLNKENYDDGLDSLAKNSFQKMRAYLDKNIGTIFAIEHMLYSRHLMTAGRTDLIAEWDGEPAIIDCKTSRKLKKEEWIENYFLQCTAYSIMLQEMTGLSAKKIVVAIAPDNEEVQIFVKPRKDYLEQVISIFKSNKYKNVVSGNVF